MRWTASGLVVLVVGGGLWLAGATPTPDHGRVEREADSITSSISEAAMFAGIVADGHGVDRATKSHAQELADGLGASATYFSRSELPGGTEQSASTLANAASDAADALDALSARPGDTGRAKHIQGLLDQYGKTADDAAKELES
jgi:hypothetical protein